MRCPFVEGVAYLRRIGVAVIGANKFGRQVIERGLPEKLKTGGWSAKLKQIIPSYGQSLIDTPALCRQVRSDTAAVLNLDNISQPAAPAISKIA